MYLQFHSVKEPSKNHVLSGFGFCSVLYGIGFGLGSCTFFTFGFGLGSVLGKTWVLVWFVLAGFGFFPISENREDQPT